MIRNIGVPRLRTKVRTEPPDDNRGKARRANGNLKNEEGEMGQFGDALPVRSTTPPDRWIESDRLDAAIGDSIQPRRFNRPISIFRSGGVARDGLVLRPEDRGDAKGVAMISKNWMKAIALAAVAGLIPAVGFAKTHYTGKVTNDFANVVNPVVAPVASVSSPVKTMTVSTKHTKGVVKHHKKHLTSTKHKKTALTHKKKI
jgi:hypothetical protein